MKLYDFKGVVYNLSRNILSLSLAIKVAENNEKNDKPNIIIPGANLSISIKSAGIFACVALKSKSKTNGNARPKIIFKGSLTISLNLCGPYGLPLLVN